MSVDFECNNCGEGFTVDEMIKANPEKFDRHTEELFDPETDNLKCPSCDCRECIIEYDQQARDEYLAENPPLPEYY